MPARHPAEWPGYGGSPLCRSQGVYQRADTESALTFLAQFL